MKNVIIFLFSLLLVSCFKNEVIKYEFNGVTITRIDKNAETYFYYGDYIKSKIPYSIKAEYKGFFSGMGAYLIFQPNGEVELINLIGMFTESENAYAHLRLKRLHNIQFLNWRDSIKGNYNNVICVFSNLKVEQEENIKRQSNVNAIYPD